MNTKRIIFWICFFVVLALIIWGLVVAMNKPAVGTTLGAPATVTSADHVIGSASAPVTLIEYSDFQCPACGMYYPLVERLLNEASTSVRLVYRHFPLPQHFNAPLAAYASESADRQGKFWEMYRLLFTNQKDWSDLSNIDAHVVFEKYAKSLNLDVSKFKADIDSDDVKARVMRDAQEGTTLGINSTPTFFVNGKSIVNPQDYESFKKLIEASPKGSAN